MNFIQLQFQVASEVEADKITALLYDTDFLGCEVMESSLHISYQENQFDEPAIREICTHHNLHFTVNSIPQQNWNKQWESDFQPIYIGKDIVVRASFHKAEPDFNYELIITPKMSFGTGHHATTQLMLRALLNLNCTKQQVLDYGCGTGVLGILAKKRGAAKVVGIDIDDWCIENSIENAQLNGEELEFLLGNIDKVNDRFDLILANINLNILVANMELMWDKLHPGGTLLLSGILETDLDSILSSTSYYGFNYVSKEILNHWMCLQLTKPE